MSAKLGTLTLDLVARTGSFTQDMKSAGDSVTRESKRIETGANSAVSALKNLGAVALAGITVGSVIESADAYVQMAAQIRNATENTAEYNQVQKHLLQTANTTYRSLQEAQQVYLDVGGALKAYGATTEQALRITDSLSFSYTHNATAADKASTATNAFMKSLYEGKVTGDSWRSMLSAIPSIVDDLSRSLGKSKAEILSLGNAGKITTEQLKASFDQNREISEELANSMENSLKDGLTNLNTAWTAFVGELNLSYGVTNKMAGSLGILADNLGTVVSIATVGAAFWAGTYIPTVYASILALKGKVATQIESMRAEQLASEITAQRTARVAQATTVELANAEAQLARMTGMARIAYLETTILPLRQANTTALAADTVAQNANNTSKNLGAIAGSRLATALMGPVGLGLAVATVAAGFILMSDSTDKASSALEDQGLTVDQLKEKYSKLNAEQLKLKAIDAAEAIEKENSKIVASINTLDMRVYKLLTGQGSQQQANALQGYLDDIKAGGDKASSALATLESKKVFTSDQIKSAAELGAKIKNSRVEIERQNQIIDIATGKNSTLAKSHDNITNSINKQINAQKELNEDQQNAYDKLKNQLLREEYIQKNMKLLGWSRERAEFQANVRNDAKMGYTGGQTPADLRAMSDAVYALEKKAEARKKAEQDTAKALKDQEGSAKRLVGISGNSGIGSGAHLDIRYGGSRDGQKVSKEHLARIQAGGKSLSSYRMSSDYGPRKAPVKGASTFHKGIDFAMPVGTPLTTNVAVKDVQTKHNAGKGYYSIVTFEDGVVLELLHQAPGMKDKVKGGASNGTLKSAQDLQKQAEDQAKSRKDLELEVANEVTKIRENLKDKLIEIDKAGFSTQDSQKLKAEYQARANAEIAIAEYALQTKLDDYADFQKTEEQLLKKSFDQKMFYASKDIELSEVQKAKALQLLGEQLKQEQAMLELARAQREYSQSLETAARFKSIQDRIAMAQAPVSSRDKLSLAQGQDSAYRDNDNDYVSSLATLQEQLNKREIVEAEHLKRVEEARRLHRENEYAISLEYKQKEDDLIQTQYQNQMGIWQDLLSRSGAIFGQMAEMVKSTAGESSAAYKTMFLVNQGISIAQALINTEVAATKAMAEGGYVAGVSMATAIRALGYTSVGLIAGQTISGMAHNGIDNIPKEGTWLLDGGERVLNPQQNKDLTKYLSNQDGGGGGDIEINVYVTESGTTTQTNQADQKQLGQALGNAVRAVIRQEQRQGGLLSK